MYTVVRSDSVVLDYCVLLLCTTRVRSMKGYVVSRSRRNPSQLRVLQYVSTVCILRLLVSYSTCTCMACVRRPPHSSVKGNQGLERGYIEYIGTQTRYQPCCCGLVRSPSLVPFQFCLVHQQALFEEEGPINMGVPSQKLHQNIQLTTWSVISYNNRSITFNRILQLILRDTACMTNFQLVLHLLYYSTLEMNRHWNSTSIKLDSCGNWLPYCAQP